MQGPNLHVFSMFGSWCSFRAEKDQARIFPPFEFFGGSDVYVLVCVFALVILFGPSTMLEKMPGRKEKFCEEKYDNALHCMNRAIAIRTKINVS